MFGDCLSLILTNLPSSVLPELLRIDKRRKRGYIFSLCEGPSILFISCLQSVCIMTLKAFEIQMKAYIQDLAQQATGLKEISKIQMAYFGKN